MTVAAPEKTSTTPFDDLDFDAPVLCDVNECHEDHAAARAAVALLVRRMPCCTENAPTCQPHANQAEEARRGHKPVVCLKHHVITCAHLAVSIKPLP